MSFLSSLDSPVYRPASLWRLACATASTGVFTRSRSTAPCAVGLVASCAKRNNKEGIILAPRRRKIFSSGSGGVLVRRHRCGRQSQCLHHRIVQRRTHLLDLRIFPRRVHAIRQQHHKKLPVRIDPDRSARESRVPKTVCGKIVPARSAFGRHRPAERPRAELAEAKAVEPNHKKKISFKANLGAQRLRPTPSPAGFR